MNKQTILVDSSSPLILYTPAEQWRPVDISNDPSAYSYSNSSSAMITGFAANPTGGKMQFAFNGTGIHIYGAKRPNHGLYNVSIDDGEPQQIDGFSSDFLFQQLLYNNSNLTNGPHTVTVVNVGGALNRSITNRVFWDCDWLSFDVQIPVRQGGAGNASVMEMNYRAAQKEDFTLRPDNGSWMMPTYTGDVSGQGLSTSTNGAILQLNFSMPSGESSGGGAVGVYGGVTNTSGNFVATLRSLAGDESVQSSVHPANYPPGAIHEVLLYYFDGLVPSTNYSLEMKNAVADDGDTLYVDLIKTWTTGGATSVIRASNPVKDGTSHAGAIAGGVVGGLIGIILVGVLITLALRRRKRASERESKNGSTLQSGMTHNDTASPSHRSLLASLPRFPPPSTTEAVTPSYQSSSSAQNYPSSAIASEVSSATQPTRSSGRVNGAGNGPRTRRAGTGSLVSGSNTSSQASSRAVRRERDAGPLARAADLEEEDEDNVRRAQNQETVLPPDYEQASRREIQTGFEKSL